MMSFFVSSEKRPKPGSRRPKPEHTSKAAQKKITILFDEGALGAVDIRGSSRMYGDGCVLVGIRLFQRSNTWQLPQQRLPIRKQLPREVSTLRFRNGFARND